MIKLISFFNAKKKCSVLFVSLISRFMLFLESYHLVCIFLLLMMKRNAGNVYIETSSKIQS